MDHLLRTLAPLALAAALVLSPGAAKAQAGTTLIGPDLSGLDSAGQTLIAIGVAATAFPAVVFLSCDIAYGAQGRWLPESWAIAQAIFGGLYVGGGAIWLGLLQDQVRQDPALVLGPGLSGTMLGTWFLIHAIVSLNNLPPSEPEDRPPPREDLSLRVAVAPLPGGGEVTLGGSF